MLLRNGENEPLEIKNIKAALESHWTGGWIKLRKCVRGMRENKEMEDRRKDQQTGGFEAPCLNNRKNREKGESEASRKQSTESPQMKGRNFQVGRAPG